MDTPLVRIYTLRGFESVLAGSVQPGLLGDDLVNGISRCDAAEVWGHARTSSSDGQRYLFPRKTLKATYSHRLGDYVLEFYTFVADNYAPFYSTPRSSARNGTQPTFWMGSSTTSPRSILRSITLTPMATPS